MIARKKVLFTISCFVFALGTFAQEDLKKEVQVIKQFEPKVADANKINEFPEINDTVLSTATFEYEIFPKQIQTEFEAEPLTPAKMVGEPLDDLFGKYARIGLGNYWTPVLGFNFHNLRSKDNSYGVLFNHESSAGKIKLPNEQKVHAGYFDQELLLFGKSFMPKSFFVNELGINRAGRHLYGYNPDSIANFDKKETKKKNFGINFNSRMKSNHTDSLHLNYDAVFNYYYFNDNHKNYENAFHAKGHFNKFKDKEKFGGDVSIDFLDRNPGLDSLNLLKFKLAPWIGFFGTKWQVKVGTKIISVNTDKDPQIYPVAFLEYNIIDNYVVPYAGVDGDYELNAFRDIARENPFYGPGIILKPSNNKFMLYAGVKGNISAMSSFNIRFKYGVVDSACFYVNDFANSLGNSFGFERDFMEYKNLFAEFEAKATEQLTMGIKGNFYHYKLQNLPYAWHKPKYDLALNWRYNLANKILFNANLFVVGEKYVKNPTKAKGYDIMETIIDLNFEAEYKYTDQISAFLKLNNIMNSKYSLWYYYPSQKFNFTVGVDYVF